MSDTVPVGERVRARRKAVGLTQSQLAVEADVSPKTVYSLEAGRRVSQEMIDAIESALSRIELLGGDEERTSPWRVERREVRPGVFLTYTITADDTARMGDVRAVEDSLRALGS